MSSQNHGHGQKCEPPPEQIKQNTPTVEPPSALSPSRTPLLDQILSEDDCVERRRPVEDKPLTAIAGLSLILGQLVAYFEKRVHVDDMDILTFSLHHLFCRMDLLFQTTLPALLIPSSTNRDIPISTSTLTLPNDQQIWMLLKTLKMTLNRIEPLYQLLSDSTEAILDTLDGTSRANEVNRTNNDLSQDEEEYCRSSINTARWEHALIAITKSLSNWQAYHSVLTPFPVRFEQVHRTISSLPQLDRAIPVL
ncbi:MAG: hypothetical protein M3Z24_10310, partial [Chloroflexota bacterium]|nr:hypothetical protein [Chloroflexota bacterium]